MGNTVTGAIAAGLIAGVICRKCDHYAELDLAGLERRGLGERLLQSLRLVCRECGSKEVQFSMSSKRQPLPPFG